MDDNDFGQFIGEVRASLKGISIDVVEVKEDIKTLLSFKSTTDERLKTGVKHFDIIDNKIECLEKRKFPSPGMVYTLIVAGFMVLGFIVAIK